MHLIRNKSSVLKILKHGKAANDVPAEFYKYAIASDGLLLELEILFKTIWDTHKIPNTWRHSKLIALWKGAGKGSRKTLKPTEDYK